MKPGQTCTGSGNVVKLIVLITLFPTNIFKVALSYCHQLFRPFLPTYHQKQHKIHKHEIVTWVNTYLQ